MRATFDAARPGGGWQTAELAQALGLRSFHPAAETASEATAAGAGFRAALLLADGHPLSGLWAELEAAGRRLVTERSPAALARYRAVVQAFVARALAEVEPATETTVSGGRARRFRLVRQIDAALLRLAEALTAAPAVELLAALGALEGLLLDLIA
ncbi:DUF327 family protein [Hydrogenibacillus sp. N12]|uniref:DUF327 family protein n=1 Tax=Hydrogenibacillus sp. N12 TaxID=2866627 RepID=UPI001C7D7C47|nr:DUF327 family protein [Hydrogenibacillus sp. N12]QZA32809.1 DUF327 family protein [Hydrogenibacillus sp. N12]